MRFRSSSHSSDTQRRRLLQRRLIVLHGSLIFCSLIVVARLLELQLLRSDEYRAFAQNQHYGGVVLPARRGDILARNSKTNETSILATNTTLDMLYVDPLVTDDPALIADALADVLLTDALHQQCSTGDPSCPRQLVPFYREAFDSMLRLQRLSTDVVLEPIPLDNLPIDADALPNITEARRQFARDIEERIQEKNVRFVPLLYGAHKQQMQQVSDLGLGGVMVSWETNLIYADPEQVAQDRIPTIARQLSDILDMDVERIQNMLQSRPLRYVPILQQLSPQVSARIRELKAESQKLTAAKRQQAPSREAAQQILDPFRCIALVPEHWRYYPDGSIASHIVGFLNVNQDPQYGIERTFDPQLRGQAGRITAMSDRTGGQIVTGDQTIVDARDGSTIVLTIDRFVQKEVERILTAAVEEYEADSGQVIVMNPQTGEIIAMANAPIFDSNNYGTVYAKEPMFLEESKRREIVVELYHPKDHTFVLRGYVDDVFTASGRLLLSEVKQQALAELEQLYTLEDIVRYYMYVGENSRWEIFPTEREDVWLRYSNKLGVGAYLNRAIQEIYEPGSVFKPITMAIAIDQGELSPWDTYDDNSPVEVDEYTIRNAFHIHYGTVSMVNCLEYSINTCMTHVSGKLGRKLFQKMIERFGFGRISGIELEDELPGTVMPWKQWSNALLATASYGQGISATPLQLITAFAALANGGKLLRPTIIDHTVHSDGTVEYSRTHVVDQVITPETSETMTAMLVSTVTNGYAKQAKVPGYRIAGKTGTSQIAGPGGKYEAGTGSTIASFMGYAPVHDPRFIALVKFDRPRKPGYEHGSATAAPVFSDIAAFLLKYYGIPPDDL